MKTIEIVSIEELDMDIDEPINDENMYNHYYYFPEENTLPNPN